MKNDTTFDIESKQLNKLISDNKFEDADQLCSRMLRDYNQFDYELLLKRARVRQCLMKYEEAALDASLALNILPQRMDAYKVLSDFLVALNNYSEALKILEILHNHDPSDILIKGQYEQIKEKEKKKGQRSIAKMEAKAQRQEEQRQLNTYQYTQIKAFLEKSYNENEEQKELGQIQKHHKVDSDDLVMLSDELLEDSDEEGLSTQMSMTSEKPGNAQHLETPRIQQQIDFRLVNAAEMFHKKKEVYKMKPEKVSVTQCQLCQLIFDYTSSCSHYSELTSNDLEDLKEMMPGIAGTRDLNSKKLALQKVTKSLDVLSSFKVTSLTLLQGQFSEIISLYLKVKFPFYQPTLSQRDLSILLGENSEFICQQCCCIQKDDKNPQKISLSLAQHALIIVNRSLTFQLQALMLNQKEDLINIGGLDKEKADFKIEPRITNAILEELKIELELSHQREFKNINYQTLHLLTRAVANILTLTPDQTSLYLQLKNNNTIRRIMQLLMSADSEILKDKDSKSPQFCQFFIHSLRLFIICQSIDQTSLSLQEEPSLKQLLRKYELYDKAFPENARLLNSLNGDILWFNHSSQGCHLKSFYKEQPPIKTCAQCQKTSRELKACSRCLKDSYCNRECQKNHYPKHKAQCVPPNN